MLPSEKAEIRQMLIDVISIHIAEIDGKFELIKQELGQIKEQTTKTNGRVNKHDLMFIDLEKINTEHFFKCPVKERVEILEDAEKSKKSIYKALTVIASVVTTMAAIIISYFGITKH